MDLKTFDDGFRTSDIQLICGTDEAGRGPLAGPVVAAAVVFDGSEIIHGMNDSKKLTCESRNRLFKIIKETARSWAFDVQSAESIDSVNILQASLLAMKNSVEKLTITPHLLLIDGNKTLKSALPQKAIVKGDAHSFSVAAASIVAKVTRDEIMMQMHEEFPEYGWDRNKAYPTKEHIAAVLKFGPCKYHRKSFLRNIEVWRQQSLFDNQQGETYE